MPNLIRPTDPNKLHELGVQLKKVADGALNPKDAANYKVWQEFERNPCLFLVNLGCSVVDAPPDPGMFQVIPVYDTPNVMHIKIPWAGDIDVSYTTPDDKYGNDYYKFLATYLIRKCR